MRCPVRPQTYLISLTFLAFGVACSDRSPTAPESAAERGTSSSEMPTAAGIRRPPTHQVAPRASVKLLPAGLWGGDQAELTVTADGATDRLFCAHGAVDQPILYDLSGRFDVGGWQVREGGPDPIDDTPFRKPARYTGWTDGQTIMLWVAVEGSSQSLGPFKLVRGQTSSLGPCPIL